jgi:4'-phosphopantetheinyl transferase EntD
MESIDADFISALFPPGVSVCIASPGMLDAPLFAGEHELIVGAVAKRRREFVGGRAAARCALSALGFPSMPILRRDTRAPAWPEGAVGSITHSEDFICAAVGLSNRFLSIGIDAEPVFRLETALAQMVCTEDEFDHFALLPTVGADWPLIAFSAKEAVYKCLSSLLDKIPDFQDVSLNFGLDWTGRGGAFHITDGPFLAAQESQNLIGRWSLAGRILFSACFIPISVS